MPQGRKRSTADGVPPHFNSDETKRHIMAAGRELLLAAQGALRFCKSYVEVTPESKSQPHLIQFFQKAIAVADDLGKSMLKTSPVQRAAAGITKSLFDAMEQEMKVSPASHARRGSSKTRRKGPKAKARKKG